MRKQLTCRNVEKPKSRRAEEHLGKIQGAFFMPCWLKGTWLGQSYELGQRNCRNPADKKKDLAGWLMKMLESAKLNLYGSEAR
jgi:hypothetical protein